MHLVQLDNIGKMKSNRVEENNSQKINNKHKKTHSTAETAVIQHISGMANPWLGNDMRLFVFFMFVFFMTPKPLVHGC